jgi:hypothetical protein
VIWKQSRTSFLPFNVSNIGGDLYVKYSGPTGIVNVFDTDSHFVKRFATGGTLFNPWGIAVAPADFGKFSNALLVGNFNSGDPMVGPGYISAFDPSTGAFLRSPTLATLLRFVPLVSAAARERGVEVAILLPTGRS